MLILILIVFFLTCQGPDHSDWEQMSEPVKNGIWIQPSGDFPSQPVWGHADGIQVGLSPMPGPRGLIRIYTPYLGHKKGKMINFLALEPIVKGSRGRSFSELEMSTLDDTRGKRFWSAEDALSVEPRSQTQPVQGTITREDGRETLTVYVFSEPFESGAKVYVRLKFYSDKPYEVEVTTYRTEESAELDHFIVTATMGNFARLRTLYLDSGTVTSTELWPDYRDDAFTAHRHFPVDEFIRDGNGSAYVVAGTDEENPQDVTYAQDTKTHWKYYGEKATQYWRAPESISGLECLVNGRYTYWASQSPIPGGISFENFELKAPFEQGMKMVFGVDPRSPEEFVDQIEQ